MYRLQYNSGRYLQRRTHRYCTDYSVGTVPTATITVHTYINHIHGRRASEDAVFARRGSSTRWDLALGYCKTSEGSHNKNHRDDPGPVSPKVGIQSHQGPVGCWGPEDGLKICVKAETPSSHASGRTMSGELASTSGRHDRVCMPILLHHLCAGLPSFDEATAAQALELAGRCADPPAKKPREQGQRAIAAVTNRR